MVFPPSLSATNTVRWGLVFQTPARSSLCTSITLKQSSSGLGVAFCPRSTRKTRLWLLGIPLETPVLQFVRTPQLKPRSFRTNDRGFLFGYKVDDSSGNNPFSSKSLAQCPQMTSFPNPRRAKIKVVTNLSVGFVILLTACRAQHEQKNFIMSPLAGFQKGMSASPMIFIA